MQGTAGTAATSGASGIYIGVAVWQPGDSCKTLMARADAAMYQAKHSGRNRVEVAEERALNPEEQVPL